MGSEFNSLRELVQHLLSYTRWRAAWLVVLMVAAALTEGLGLVLLVPLLAFVGLTEDPQGNSVVAALTDLFSELGLSLSLNLVLLVFVGLVFMRQILLYVSASQAADTRINYVGAVRKEFFAALGETSWRYLDGGRLDRLGQILLMDSWRIGEAALNIIRILSGFILLLANVVVAVLLTPALALTVLGAISVLTLMFSNRLRSVKVRGSKVSKINQNVYRVVENYVDNLRIAKMAGAVERMQAEFDATIDELSAEMSGFAREAESTKMALQLAGAVAIAVALLAAVHGFNATGPVLLLLIFITARFIPRVASLNQQVHSLFHDLPAFAHAYGLLQECQLRPDCNQDIEQVALPVESMGVKGVTVVAGDGAGDVLLDDVSLDIRLQEMLAIEGPSGSGKSTLANVLSGLLLPDQGGILVDRKPLGRGQIVAWRQSVGYVPQTAVLLQDTIEHNLNWVLPEPATSKEMERALQCAEIADFVAGLKNGLQTVVDRREGSVSGGERQRLAIARELLRRPQLLILDEATNALDVDTEARVLDNLRQYYPALTVVLIAHRLSAIEKADRAARLESGILSVGRPN